MKNSALIRVFSIVLAILSVVLIVTGSLGIKKAYEDKSLNERRLKKLVTAADSYEELSAKLKGKDSYSKALTKFEKHEKDYNKSAAEHKTDLAVYTYSVMADQVIDKTVTLVYAEPSSTSYSYTFERVERIEGDGAGIYVKLIDGMREENAD